jgi:hypothetical protein
MILVAGIADERPTALLIEALDACGAAYRVFDQRACASTRLAIEVASATDGGALDGALTIDGDSLSLASLRGVYLRLMDDRYLPGMRERPADDPLRARSHRLHALLQAWADIAPVRVLNRPGACGSNHSKPYQAQAIRATGLEIPETLITNDPGEARDFIETAWSDGAEVIYKSVSGVRSIVRCVTRADLDRLPQIRWCPTQFQHRVAGDDVRVHVVGPRTFAARIVTTATDYRYAARDGVEAAMQAWTLPPELAQRCVALSERLELPLAGIDLRLAESGRAYCFEVNPSPAYSFYEERTGLPIAAAIAEHLAGGAPR